MKNWIFSRVALCMCLLVLVAFNAFAEQKDLGALSSSDALDYMRAHKNIVIVDVSSKKDFARQHFANAINIPIEDISEQEAKKRYKGLPKGRPMIVHCRVGLVASAAYKEIKDLRPDIPEIGYIDGKPPFDKYRSR